MNEICFLEKKISLLGGKLCNLHFRKVTPKELITRKKKKDLIYSLFDDDF